MVKSKLAIIFLLLTGFILIGARCGKKPSNGGLDKTLTEAPGEQSESISEEQALIEKIKRYCRQEQSQQEGRCVESLTTMYLHPEGLEAGFMEWCIRDIDRANPGNVPEAKESYALVCKGFLDEGLEELKEQQKKVLQY